MGRVIGQRGRWKTLPTAVLCAAVLCVAAIHRAHAELYKPPVQRAVPAKMINGMLLVEGSITGAHGKPVVSGLFVLDTAATTTILSPETARALGGKGTPGEKLVNTTLRLAGAQVSRRPAAVYSLDAFTKEAGVPVIGIAGADIFENFGARINYVHHTLTLVVLESCATPDEHVRLKVVNGLPFVQATLQTASGKTMQAIFLVDTGQAGQGLVFTSEFLKAHPEFGPADPSLRVAGLLLGSHALKDVPATVAPPSPSGVGANLAGVIGGGILSRFDVMVDMPGSWLMLTPNDHYAEPFGADAR